MSVMLIDLKFCFFRLIRSLISQSLSPFSILEAVGIKTRAVSFGFLPTKSNKALAIDLFVIPPDVSNNFMVLFSNPHPNSPLWSKLRFFLNIIRLAVMLAIVKFRQQDLFFNFVRPPADRFRNALVVTMPLPEHSVVQTILRFFSHILYLAHQFTGIAFIN